MKMIPSSARPVAIWLVAGVIMIVLQIMLGGITRLTDSGLSITEWKPLLGTLPPMNDEQWSKAFNQYKQIAQFKQLHAYFSIEDFKSIFFLGVAAPALGPFNWYCIYYSLCNFFSKEKNFERNDYTVNHSFFIGRFTGGNWVGDGKKRFE